jgi:hypothetical protein
MNQVEKKCKIRRASYGALAIECLCSNPPWGLFRQVKTCLNWINKDDLQGLGKIILTDEIKTAETITNDEAAPVCKGLYRHGAADSPPVIFLAIPQFYGWIPSWLWWSPAITLRLCHTLAHEVGHHVSSDSNEIKNAEPAQRELIANNYAAAVIEAMTRRWYYKMGRYLIKEIAGWYFAFGLAAANYDRYPRAAKRFYAAWCLDPEMKEAAKYYWQVRRTYERDSEQSKRVT